MADPALALTQPPVAATGMLVRRPIAEVFEAFIDPAITSRFWFTKGSGRLEVGRTVQWEWAMYDISIPVTVKDVEPGSRILLEWPGDEGCTTVEWLFRTCEPGTTFVSVTNAGFRGDGDRVVRQATDATEGFTLVLAGLKALLERGVELSLVADRFPMERNKP